MILVESLIKILKKNSIDFFTGVPDSVLKNLSTYLNNSKKKKHLIASNEGGAIGLAIGYYLSTKKLAVVYMQNSGLTNALNPLLSLSHKKIYSIPMLLLIGWRGAPGVKDEPQHMIMGKLTKKFLSLADIKFITLNNKKDLLNLPKLIKFSKKYKKPVACIIKKNQLSSNITNNFKPDATNLPTRAIVLKKILNIVNAKTKIISNTGFASRELYHIRSKKKYKGKDFYLVGGMGHTAMVALGNSIFYKGKTICIDGDGSMLMHLGSLNLYNQHQETNLKYILFNNNSHESVGRQATNINNLDIKKIAQGFRFKTIERIKNERNLEYKLKKFLNSKKISFLEIKIKNDTFKNLMRPKDFIKIKENFKK